MPGGFRELNHTADVRIQVWAADLDGLFAWAGHGMLSLCGMRTASAPLKRRTFLIQADDYESLLVNFLGEILFYFESESLGLAELAVSIRETTLTTEVSALPLLGQERLIKAVTYHDLALRQSPAGWQVEIVFDV